MLLIVFRRLAVPASAALFAVVITLPPPAAAESMPAVTLVLFLFAIAALGIAGTASAMIRRRTSQFPLRVPERRSARQA